jgi:hypothetical protein
MLEKAEPAALRLLPPKVAAKHKVVPLALERKKLQVAMIDPTDLIVLDELAFITGCQIVPDVAPEVRRLSYRERYYDVSRPLRYIQLADPDVKAPQGLDAASLAAQFTDGQLDLSAEKGLSPAAAAAAARAAAAGRTPAAPETAAPTGEKVLSISDLLEGGDGGADAVQEAADALEHASPEELRQVDTATDEQRALMEAALEKLKEKRQQEALDADAAEEEQVRTLADVSRLLAEAETREDIGEALLRYMRSQFPRVILYVAQRDRALGWQAHLPGQTPDQCRVQARRVIVPLGEASVLQGVAQTGSYYMGELPARPGDQALAAALGEPSPTNLVILPVKLNEKPVILLQGDNLDQPLGGFDMRSLRSACQKAGLAMEVLLLRSKIRTA